MRMRMRSAELKRRPRAGAAGGNRARGATGAGPPVGAARPRGCGSREGTQCRCARQGTRSAAGRGPSSIPRTPPRCQITRGETPFSELSLLNSPASRTQGFKPGAVAVYWAVTGDELTPCSRTTFWPELWRVVQLLLYEHITAKSPGTKDEPSLTCLGPTPTLPGYFRLWFLRAWPLSPVKVINTPLPARKLISNRLRQQRWKPPNGVNCGCGAGWTSQCSKTGPDTAPPPRWQRGETN